MTSHDNVICSVSAWGFIKIMPSHGPVGFFVLGPEMRMIMAMTRKNDDRTSFMLKGCHVVALKLSWIIVSNSFRFKRMNLNSTSWTLMVALFSDTVPIMRWLWLMGSPLFQNTKRSFFILKCQSIETSFVSWLLWNHRENHHYVKSSWIVTDWHHLRNCFAKETHGSTGSTGCFLLTRREEVQLLMDQAECCVSLGAGTTVKKKDE